MELGLNANGIDDKGAQYFADALGENKVFINVSYMYIQLRCAYRHLPN